MSKVQTRRTISFNRHLFDLATTVAGADGKSLSEWVTAMIRDRLVAAGFEVPETQHAGIAHAKLAAKGKKRARNSGMVRR